jgi:hypothetical protein
VDNLAYWGLGAAVVLAFSLVASLVIARMSGANENGNDDHELREPPDDY